LIDLLSWWTISLHPAKLLILNMKFLSGILTSGMAILMLACNSGPSTEELSKPLTLAYQVPDTAQIPNGEEGEMIRYGRNLILNFPEYLGPEGSVGAYAGNKLNCSNCHLEGGTRPNGLNFFSSHARYPQFRAREGKILNLAERINNCIERPLNGKPIPLDSKEMNAMLSYMKWVSTGVETGKRVPGDDLPEIPLPTRPANPEKGALVYQKHCQRCHAQNGEGVQDSMGKKYLYPPLWGKNSYQPGSSMHRLIKHAAFVYGNMPYDIAKPGKPVLTPEEAFDVAAFVNDDRIHPRPYVDLSTSYPMIHHKPADFPIGPFDDPYPAEQHKFGPFGEIIEWQKKHRSAGK
jgi:thiosulfate dehydrogenase